MGRSQESFNKKEVRKKKEKKRLDKEKKRLSRKDDDKQSLDEMIAYVDEYGNITSTPPDPDEKEEIDPDDIEVSVSKTLPGDEEDKKHSGIVTFYNDAKGFGFIRDLDTQQSIFVHTSNTLAPINEGNRVSFEIGKGPKGPTALEVKPE
jgi:cold shock CspA family protein